MSVIDEVKSRLDIVDVVSQYVKLTRSGKNYKGLSPFQSERTPSFYVFPDTQTYKDFSSGEQGDVFKFVMKKEGWTFGEALRELAHRAGVQLEVRTEEQKKSADHEMRLREACALAAEYFHRLFLTAPQAAHCRTYVKTQRSLSDQTIATWQIGYSLVDHQALNSYLAAKGFAMQELIDAGLVIENEEGRRYDRFRGRLMIPIRDDKGRVAGFGSRSLDGSEPKYMNSPQTLIFDKGRLLFGLDQARSTIRNQQTSVIVEGYMDVIGTHQAGFTNVVAGMGTALTEDQFRILKKLADRIVLALDADAAGNKAVLRGVDVARDALEHDGNIVLDGRGVIRHESKLKADIRVALLPDGRDPDEVVLESPQLWRDAIANARPVTEHVIDIVLAGYEANAGDPRAKSDAVKAVAPILQDLADPVQRDFYVQQLARRLQITPRAITQAISLVIASKPAVRARSPQGQVMGPNKATQAAAASASLPAEAPSATPAAKPADGPTPSGKVLNLELHLLAVLVKKPELLMDANVVLTRHNLDVMSGHDFLNPALQQGFQQLSRAAMGQPMPMAEANDDWLSILADYTLPNDSKDELFLREEVIRTALRLREENLAREQSALFFVIQEAAKVAQPVATPLETVISPAPAPAPAPATHNLPSDNQNAEQQGLQGNDNDEQTENDMKTAIPAPLAETLPRYNLKLQQIATQRLRAQKALRLRNALSVD